MSSAKNRKIMDEVREVMQLHHYSIHTERSYCDWIKRFIRFHKMKSRDALKDGGTQNRRVSDASGCERACFTVHAESGNECFGISVTESA